MKWIYNNHVYHRQRWDYFFRKDLLEFETVVNTFRNPCIPSRSLVNVVRWWHQRKIEDICSCDCFPSPKTNLGRHNFLNKGGEGWRDKKTDTLYCKIAHKIFVVFCRYDYVLFLSKLISYWMYMKTLNGISKILYNYIL